MTLFAVIISRSGGYHLAMPCDKINYILGSPEETMRWYPGCSPYLNGSDTSQKVVVDADIFGPNRAQFAAAFNLTYGMGGWLAMLSHAIGVELYVCEMYPSLASKMPQALITWSD